MKRPAHLTLVDADRYSALVSRCTEQRERAEKAEARIEALEKELQELKDAIDGKTHLRDASRAAEEKP